MANNNLIIDPTNDHLIQKTYKDGKKITFKYDPAGNMIEKSRTWADGSQGQKLTYTYNYQDQIAQANDSGYNVMTAGYDHENQRVYTDMPGINPWNGQKFYYWNQSGAIIGEGKVGKTITFKYTQMSESRNSRITQMHTEADLKYQVSNAVSFRGFRALRDSDNINNAQGTPVLIVDEQNNAISKINLDEWGNVGDKTTGPQQEINYTGKKLDIPTRLYYFNQRYYDPEIGRFVNEDPAKQAFNPYLYCGNNPLKYTDPDGQFFTELFTAVCPGLGTLIGAALDAGTVSAAINAGGQYLTTGQVNWNSVGQSFVSGALGSVAGGIAGINFGSGFVNELGASAVKTGLGNVLQGGMQGDWRMGERFMSGAAQGAGDYLANVAMNGVSSWTQIPSISGPNIKLPSIPSIQIHHGFQIAMADIPKHPIFGDLIPGLKVPEKLPKPYDIELEEFEKLKNLKGWRKAGGIFMKFLEILENKMFLIMPMDQENLMEASGMNMTATNSIKNNQRSRKNSDREKT